MIFSQKVSWEERLKALYDSSYFLAYRNDPKREAWYRAERDRIVSLKKEGRILDVGCGLGKFLELFPVPLWDKYGVDISDVAVQEARSKGIRIKSYDQAYDYPEECFDVIVFRGSLQHLDTPFSVIKRCIALLKPGGWMVFLSTPNSNSLCYKLFGTLPFLDSHLNFLIPSDTMLRDVLTNFGLRVTEIRYPYLETPYARPVRDHLCFVLRCLGISLPFAFWRNIMEVYAFKPGSLAAQSSERGPWAAKTSIADGAERISM